MPEAGAIVYIPATYSRGNVHYFQLHRSRAERFSSPTSFACSDLRPFRPVIFLRQLQRRILLAYRQRCAYRQTEERKTEEMVRWLEVRAPRQSPRTPVSETQDNGKTPPVTYIVTVTASTADGARTHVMQLVFHSDRLTYPSILIRPRRLELSRDATSKIR